MENSTNKPSREPLEFVMDFVRQEGENILFRGWVLDDTNTLEIEIKDESNRSISYTLKKISRIDVVRAFQLTEDMLKCGFEIRVERKTVKGANLYVRFKNKETQKEFRLDMKQYNAEFSKKARLKKALGRDRWRSNLSTIKRVGVSQFIRDIRMEIDPELSEYQCWLEKKKVTSRELKAQRKTVFTYAPKISIVVPLYNTPLAYLKELLDSICGQSYGNWQLCLADASSEDQVESYIKDNYSDNRIIYRRLAKNSGISENTNAALNIAQGEYIMLSDHDDILERDALFEIVKVLNEEPAADVVYTDEDKVTANGKKYFDPYFKPDFNIDLLRSTNYICHIFVAKRQLIEEVGFFSKEFDGAQDYDMILRCCEKASKICHIPKILYHWRAHEQSTAGNQSSKEYAIAAGRKALEGHYRRLGLEAEIEYTGLFIIFRTKFKIKGFPKVSIIILSKDHVEDLNRCVESIEQKSTWRNYEIIIAENNSEKPETFEYYRMIQEKYANIRVIRWKDEFNYSAINNFGAAHAEGDYYILLNNDTEVITPDWIEQMLGYCQRDDVGIVGAKLYYPEGTVQHAGAVIGLGGFAGHVLMNESRDADGYFGRLKTVQDISAVTAACLMIKKECYLQVGGMDEQLKVALNDMDLCLKVREAGKLVVFNPWVELYHYESKSRGLEDTPEKHERFKTEIKRFRDRWKDVLEKGDPYYNPNLTLERGDFGLRSDKEQFAIIDEILGESKCSRKS